MNLADLAAVDARVSKMIDELVAQGEPVEDLIK